jgi:hypothetical protein
MSTELDENLREGKMSAREGRDRIGLGWVGPREERRWLLFWKTLPIGTGLDWWAVKMEPRLVWGKLGGIVNGCPCGSTQKLDSFQVLGPRLDASHRWRLPRCPPIFFWIFVGEGVDAGGAAHVSRPLSTEHPEASVTSAILPGTASCAVPRSADQPGQRVPRITPPVKSDPHRPRLSGAVGRISKS